VPHANSKIPQILNFKLNGKDKCSFCGQRLEEGPVALINRGTKVNDNHKYPWHAAIYHKENADLKYKCGASIIRDNKLITAAHCVFNAHGHPLHENVLLLRVEKGELFTSPLQYNVFKSIVHERYNFQTFENDIALLVIETHLDILYSFNIRAICLPTKGSKFNGE
jgi:V8-like Glu-specific endopeptidase